MQVHSVRALGHFFDSHGLEAVAGIAAMASISDSAA